MTAPSSLRYLSAADVETAMPGIEERLRLAEQTMVALDGAAELPPKIGVHPAETSSFAHAMPALLRGTAGGAEELVGLKWVTGFPGNVASGLPAIHATTILSDSRTGLPRAFVDAGALTAARTAAVSGLAIRRWGPRARAGVRVALVGAGAQARSHLPVIGHLLPGAEIVLCDRDLARAEALAGELATDGAELVAGSPARTASRAPESGRGMNQSHEPSPGRGVVTTSDPTDAVADADLVLTLISFGPDRQAIPEEAFAPGATIVAVDYDMCVPASVAAGASLFLVDHREQYLANRTSTAFLDYPDEVITIGEAIRGGMGRPSGRVLITHLGVGLADVVFADAVLRTAESSGIGMVLPR